MQRLGDFQVLGELGRGEFGVVYECRAEDGTVWALKACKVDPSPLHPKRKETKLQISNRLLYWESEMYRMYATNHVCFPKLPPRPYRDNAQGWRFLAMELLPGGTLRQQVMGTKPLVVNSRAVFSVGLRILLGLQHLNQQGFVYRDLKPENICLTGDERGVVLVDLGTMQKFLDAKQQHFQTVGNVSVGTPQFMSIQVHQGLAASRRDDLESLGYVLMWVLNRGEIPLWGKSKSEAEMLQLKLNPGRDYGVLNEYFDHVLGLGVESTPDYAMLAKLFADLGGTSYGVVDWSGEVSSKLPKSSALKPSTSKPIAQPKPVVQPKPIELPKPTTPQPTTPPKRGHPNKRSDVERRVVQAVKIVQQVERATLAVPPKENGDQLKPTSSWVSTVCIVLLALAGAALAVWFKHS